MSDSKKFHEMDDRELEQVAGGSSKNIPVKLYCPVCGATTTQYYSESDTSYATILCFKCQFEGRGRVPMNFQ